jgi:hypothetical protein
MAAIQIADMAQTASNALPTHQRNREIIRGKIEKPLIGTNAIRCWM